jgi:hypothetical protein
VKGIGASPVGRTSSRSAWTGFAPRGRGDFVVEPPVGGRDRFVGPLAEARVGRHLEPLEHGPLRGQPRGELLLPLRLPGIEVRQRSVEPGLQLGRRLAEDGELLRLVGSGHLHDGRRVLLVPVHLLPVHAVEEREELVVLLLADGVELVIVAAGAGEGQREEDLREGLGAVEDVAAVDFLLDRPAFAGRHVAAVEAAGHLLVERRVLEQVARELLGDEAVEGHVVVEGPDDPLAVRPDLAIVVEVQAVGVAVAGEVEPEARHVFAVAGRRQEPVDELLVRVRRGVGDEGLDFGRRRGQAAEVERHAAGEGRPVRSGDGRRPSSSRRARI